MDECKILFKLIGNVLWNQATFIVENLRVVVHAILAFKNTGLKNISIPEMSLILNSERLLHAAL